MFSTGKAVHHCVDLHDIENHLFYVLGTGMSPNILLLDECFKHETEIFW